MDKVITMHLTPERASRGAGSLAGAILQAMGPAADFFAPDPGETLFSFGQRPGTVLILLEGQVKLSTDSEGGRTLIFEVAGPDAILGLSSVIAGEPYDRTARTLTLCRLASVMIYDFDSLLRGNRHTQLLAISELNNSYKRACNQIQLLGEPSIPVRLARAILGWASNGQGTERGVRFHIPLNQGEIGEYIGARRETVTRVLGEFQKRGLIDIKGSLFTMTDRHGLEICAGLPDFDELA